MGENGCLSTPRCGQCGSWLKGGGACGTCGWEPPSSQDSEDSLMGDWDQLRT